MAKKTNARVTLLNLIDSLNSFKFSFSAKDAAKKIDLIEKIASKKLLNPTSIMKYLEPLCFMQAYPDNPRFKKLVDDELAGFSDRVEHFKYLNGYDDERIDDIGIADTLIRYPYNYIMSNWLVEKYGTDIDIDWEYYNEKENDPLSGLLNIFALYAENDGVDDENLSAEEWVDRALADGQTALSWLLNKLDKLKASFEVKQYLYDNAELMLKWHIGKTKAARTLAMAPRSEIFYQNRPMRKSRFDLRRTSRTSPPKLSLLSEKEGNKTIKTLILALLPRHRELYPTLYANPAEVYVTSPGKGLEIYIIGMKPENRMPFETNYSGLLIKNGVPIGYAIAVLLFERCEIAINVFDTFRSGEAGMIFNHFLKLFYHHFGGREFIMRRWQVGHENEEGLQSGSFWFYYKLGFRSTDLETAQFAKTEEDKIKKNRSYRCDLKTLKKLALSDMLVDLRPRPRRPFKELPVADIGLAVTDNMARRNFGDNETAIKESLKYVRRALKIGSLKGWSQNERIQLERWSPLLYSIDGLSGWRQKDKRALVALIKAKAAKREKKYVALLQKHNAFQRSLERLAESQIA